MTDLEFSVISWANERDIFKTATPATQMLKTVEEVGELASGIAKRDRAEIQDAIGDVAVTLILQAHMHGLTLEHCLRSAYNTISKRTGKMVNGVFVKD